MNLPSGDPTAHLSPGPCTTLPTDVEVAELPSDVAALVRICQGLLVHVHLAAAYGVELTDGQRADVHLRSVDQVVERVLAIDGSSIDVARNPAQRAGGNCRQLSVLLVALLRATGTRARARCGFSDYFGTARWEDHWVAEVWDDGPGRWRLVDAQLDPRQRELFAVDLDPLDVPADRFQVAGAAWRRCRRGDDDADRYGLTSLGESGPWWIAGNLMRDLASLQGIELLPWDSWAAMPRPFEDVEPAVADLLDDVAEATAPADAPGAHGRRRELWSDPRLALGAVVHDDLLDRDDPAPAL